MNYFDADDNFGAKDLKNWTPYNYTDVLEEGRIRREIIERQTNERYTTTRRKCRVIRRCRAQSRSDEDVDDLNFVEAKDQGTTNILWRVGPKNI